MALFRDDVLVPDLLLTSWGTLSSEKRIQDFFGNVLVMHSNDILQYTGVVASILPTDV